MDQRTIPPSEPAITLVLPLVVSQPALGVGAAMNHGVELARGQYLAFLDCDDVWPRDRLVAMIQAMERDPELDYAFGSVVNTDERLDPINTPQPARLLGSLLMRRSLRRAHR